MLQTGLTRNFPASNLRARLYDGDLVPNSLFRALWDEDLGSRNWVPAVDVRETGEAFHVTAELPGMAKKDVEVSIENNVLTLSGERRYEKDTKEETFHRSERSYGTFTRSFALPRKVDAEGVKATFKEGLLELVLPKQQEARPRTIEIG